MRKLVSLLDFVVKWIFRFFVSFSVRSNKIYVFGSWYGAKFADNSKFIYLSALQEQNLIPVWITKDPEVLSFLKKHHYRAYMHNSLKGIFYQLRASVYFTTVSRQDLSESLLAGAIRINLWHGIPLKKIMYDDRMFFDKLRDAESGFLQSVKVKIRKVVSNYVYTKYEYLVSSSDTITKIYARAFRKNKDQVLQFGQPRNDVFFSDHLEIEPFPFANKYSKVILYMPTHRNEGKQIMDMNALLDPVKLNEFCRVNNCLFLVKKHYYHKGEQTQDYEFVKDITSEVFDSQVLLKYADILITDYSSCYIDYLLLDRPLIFYNYDQENYTKVDRELYFNYDDVTPGIKVQTAPELLEAIRDHLTDNKDVFLEKRNQVKDLFYAKENQNIVSKIILDQVKNILMKEK